MRRKASVHLVISSDLTMLDINLEDDGTLSAKKTHRYVQFMKLVPFTRQEFYVPLYIGTYRFESAGTDRQYQVVHTVDGAETRFDRFNPDTDLPLK